MKKSSQNSKIEVSIVIVNFNTGKFLEKCVTSIVKSTKNLSDPACEIIVVDNASTDQSTDFNGQFRLIRNLNNPGFPKANNQAIKVAQGNYILLLNPDTEIKDEAVQKLLEFAETRSDAGVVVPQLLNVNRTVQDSVMPRPLVGRAIAEFWFGQKVYSKYVPKFTTPTEIEAAVMAAFLITPHALEKVGMLAEKYFMYFEDLDYCRRVREAGLKVYYLPTAKVIHHHGVSGRNLVDEENQWRRLIPGSKTYHGALRHWLINFIIWISQKLK